MSLEPAPSVSEVRTWAMIMHLSQLANLIPGAGIIIPILIWQLKKGAMPELDVHGKIIANWLISALIYGVISGLLLVALVGFILLPILGVLGIIFPIIGAVKANNGEVWKYPLTITFFR